MDSKDLHLPVFNCHEAWTYPLSFPNAHLDIMINLPGHYSQTWDEHCRPIPPKSRPTTLDYKEAFNDIPINLTDHNPGMIPVPDPEQHPPHRKSHSIIDLYSHGTAPKQSDRKMEVP